MEETHLTHLTKKHLPTSKSEKRSKLWMGRTSLRKVNVFSTTVIWRDQWKQTLRRGKKLKWEENQEIVRRESQCKEWKFIFSRKWGKVFLVTKWQPIIGFYLCIYLLVKWEEKSQHVRAWENKHVAHCFCIIFM